MPTSDSLNDQWIAYLHQLPLSSISQRRYAVCTELYRRYDRGDLSTQSALLAMYRSIAVFYSVLYREAGLPKKPKMDVVRYITRSAMTVFGHDIGDHGWRVVSCIVYEELRSSL